MKKVVFTFGRMNPPTVGHQKLVDKVKAEAKKQGADARVYLSHTQNKKKDPLDYNSKVKYATKAFGSIVTKTNAKTIIQVLKELQSAGYTDVTLIVGSDRIPEFKKLLTKYNGKDYTFNSINFTSAGQRDPDAEGVEGMSASKMRALAVEGDFASFKSGLPKGLQSMAKEIYNKLRNIMEEEDKQLDEGVLTLQQRQKRSRLMKRLSKKLQRKKKIAAKRMADSKKIQKRALKKARQLVRKKVAGEKGTRYASLSSAEKITIDKLVDKKHGMIAKIAKKLLPKVRKAEMERLRKARGPKTEERETLTLNSELNERIDPRKEPNLFRAQREIEREKQRDKMKFDRMRDGARVRDTIYRNRKEGVNEGGEAADFDMDPEEKATRKQVPVPTYYKDKGVKTWKDMPKLKVKDENPPRGMQLAHLTVKGEENLREKAERNGIEFEELLAVYESATIDSNSNNTEEQQRFQAVNHYIAEGPLVMTRSNAVKTLSRIADDQVNKMNDKQLKTFAQVLGKTINKQATGKYVVEEDQLDEVSVADVKAKLSDYVLRTTGQGTSNAKGEKIVYTDKDEPKKEEKDDLKDACWKGYKAVGLKDKNGKKVPNCVPEEKELDEAIIATHYHAGAEKTAKGYRPHVTHKEKGHTMYSGGATYKSKEHAVGHAKAYVDAYAKGGDRHADRVVHNYKTQNQKHMVEDVEYIDEAKSPINITRKDLDKIEKSSFEQAKNIMHKLIQNAADKKTQKRPLRADKANVLKRSVDEKRSKDALLKMAWNMFMAGDDVGKKQGAGKVLFPSPPGQNYRKMFGEEVKELGPEGKAKEKSDKSHKKMYKDILPRSGAGQEGTDELVKNLLAQTPGMTIEEDYEVEIVEEAEGKTLNKPFRLPSGSKKKFGVYVKNEKGNTVKVTFGDPNMEIKRDDPERRKSFRARHGCDKDAGPKTKAKYWSCYQWRKGKKVED